MASEGKGQVSASPRRVLLFEAAPCSIDDTATLLRRAGYACECVRSADDMLAALEQASYDLMVVSLVSGDDPHFDLLEGVARRVRAMRIVVLFTGYLSADGTPRVLRLEVCDPDTDAASPREVSEWVAEVLETGRTPKDQLLPIDKGPLLAVVRAGTNSVGLSGREQEIVAALGLGTRVRGIAKDLGISERTVRNHLHSIFRKFGVHSQVELLASLNRRR